MSFKAIFYNNKSDKIVVNKELEKILEEDCLFKADNSLQTPVITVKIDNSLIRNINYIVIPDLARKYFVTDIKSKSGGMWEFHCKTDVLSTFFPEISNNDAIINRQEGNWNLFLNDNNFKCYQNPHIIQREFPNGFTTNSTNFILLVAGQPKQS